MLQSITAFDIASSTLNDSKGLFLGDYHGFVAIPEWIAAHLDKFKQQGVRHLYIEMIDSEQQNLINDYYNGVANADTKLKSMLQKYWGDKSPGSGIAYFELIRAAKENGIKVYGIDTDKLAEPDSTRPFQVDPRIGASNPHWAQIVRSHITGLGPNEKYLIFGGGAHSSNFPYSNKWGLTASVNQMLGIPSIDFVPSGSDQTVITKLPPQQRSDYEIGLPPSPNQRQDGEEPAKIYKFALPKEPELKQKDQVVMVNDPAALQLETQTAQPAIPMPVVKFGK